MRKLITLFIVGIISFNAWCQTEDLSITEKWKTSNTITNNYGKWTKIASCTVSHPYQDFAGVIDFIANGSGYGAMYYGRIIARFKNQNNTAQPINYWKLVLLNSNLGENNIKAIRIGKTVDLYVKMPSAYTAIYFRKIVNGVHSLSLYSDQPFYSELPQNDLVIDCVNGDDENYENRNFTVDSSGNVGIGTTNPLAKLHIKNSDQTYGAILAQANENNFQLYTKTLTTTPVNVESFRLGLKYGSDENNGFISFYRGANTSGGFLGFSTNGTERIRIDRIGNVGIGKTPDGTAKLDVAGNIKAQEIEVTLASMEDLNLNGTLAANNITVKANGQTADFVFSDTYNLKDLTEVENFIKTNKHLPNIPSAEDMEKQGVNLAEMNKLLLQKVEELTLYAIQQKEERNKEKKKRESLEQEVKNMKNMLIELHSMILENKQE